MISLDIEKKSPLCRLLICNGSICGSNTDVSFRRLEEIWIEEGLHTAIPMKICTCQDACEHASVARIITPRGTEWFEQLQQEHYDALVDWARECLQENTLLPRPKNLQKKRFKGRIKDKK